MRKFIVATLGSGLLASGLLAMGLAATPAMAKGSDAMKACAASWKGMSAADKKKTSYKAYSSDCLKNGGPRAAAEPAPMAMKGMAMKGSAMHATPAAMHADSPQDRMKSCAAKWNDMKAHNQTKGQTYRQFSSGCLKKS